MARLPPPRPKKGRPVSGCNATSGSRRTSREEASVLALGPLRPARACPQCKGREAAKRRPSGREVDDEERHVPKDSGPVAPPSGQVLTMMHVTSLTLVSASRTGVTMVAPQSAARTGRAEAVVTTTTRTVA